MVRFLSPIAIAAGLMAACLPAQAQNLASDGLERTIARLAENPAQNGFQLGMLQTLHAVEKSLQFRYEYGLGDNFIDLPVFRIGSGPWINPNPAKAQPDTLSNMFLAFVGDIATARKTLELAERDGVVPFDMTLQDLWFDINRNGTHDKGENAIGLLGPVILGGGNYTTFSKSDAAKSGLTVHFDHADHAWLTAYTNMLSGFGNLYLAFDPEPVLRNLAVAKEALENAPTIPNVYDIDALELEVEELQAQRAEINTQLKELNTRIQPLRKKERELRQKQRETEEETRKAEIDAELKNLREEIEPLFNQQRELSQDLWLIRNELASVQSKLPTTTSPITLMAELDGMFVDFIDLAYTVIAALGQQPDPARIRAAYDDWRAMIDYNRKFWALLDQETDNDREWIPNARQKSALPMEIPVPVAEGWQAILSDAQAVLDGELLVPHPLLPQGYGISLPAYVQDPSPLDLVDWIHGIGAYRYAAKGPRITAQSWSAFQRLTRGNAGGFALFFN